MSKNKGVKMAKSIKARFSKGMIEPLEKLEFEEGKEMIITISEVSYPWRLEGFN